MFFPLLYFCGLLFFILNDGQSIISELFEYFKEEYFTPHFGDYTHFTFSEDSAFSFQSLVICLFIGINLASLAVIFDRRVLGNFVRKLISENCLSADRAKTLSELGFFKNAAVRGSLRSGVTLRRVVRCVEEEEYNKALESKRAEYNAAATSNAFSDAGALTKRKGKRPSFREVPFKINFETARFYIPEELKYMAEIKFERKGTNWLSFFLVFVLSIAMMIVVFRIAPDIFQMLDNFLTMFSE